jgi:hypothetical protein
MRHSRKQGSVYLWKKANLSISLRGRVYKIDEAGCFCKEPFVIDADKSKNTFWLIMEKKVGNEFIFKPFKAKKTDPWNCAFKISDRNISELRTVQVNCD